MLEYLAQNFGYILVAGVLLPDRRRDHPADGAEPAGGKRRLRPRLRGLRPRRSSCHPEARREPDKSAAGPGARTGGE